MFAIQDRIRTEYFDVEQGTDTVTRVSNLAVGAYRVVLG
jgi:hypothetical protein